MSSIMKQIQPKFIPFLLVTLIFLGWSNLTFAVEITTEEIKYQAGNQTMVGYLAQPKLLVSGAPAILVVHEWWGQTDYPRKRARMLAKLGYIAMAVDMYGDRQITDHPKEAGAFSKAVFSSAKNVRGRFDAALEALVKHSMAQTNNIVAIGYCFGGSVVLEMARQGLPLKGVASFHGGLKTPSKANSSTLKARVLVLHGAADPMTKPGGVEVFNAEMKAASAKYKFISYAGAKHGFTNPQASVYAKNLGFKALGYQKKADLESWAELQRFLKSF
ncbi:MAG: dienelactone hydrolase family protein [SAR324 cluster bacterium]|nr:dienelactone hydrolase family protein [SAR324 cluster bacterium]